MRGIRNKTGIKAFYFCFTGTKDHEKNCLDQTCLDTFCKLWRTHPLHCVMTDHERVRLLLLPQSSPLLSRGESFVDCSAPGCFQLGTIATRSHLMWRPRWRMFCVIRNLLHIGYLICREVSSALRSFRRTCEGGFPERYGLFVSCKELVVKPRKKENWFCETFCCDGATFSGMRRWMMSRMVDCASHLIRNAVVANAFN